MAYSRWGLVGVLCLGVLLLMLTLVMLSSCSRLQEMDRRIWGMPPPPGPAGSGPADSGAPGAPGGVPPIVQTLAGVLALAGYGGMAAWIRRSNRNGRATVGAVEQRLEALEVFVNDYLRLAGKGGAGSNGERLE